jgi:hypothetical protein
MSDFPSSLAGHQIEEPQPQWTHDDCVQYEVAREAITGLMAFRSQWIFDEQQKQQPDDTAIQEWRRQRAQLASELQGLDVTDRATNDRICREYGAEIQRLATLAAGTHGNGGRG